MGRVTGILGSRPFTFTPAGAARRASSCTPRRRLYAAPLACVRDLSMCFFATGASFSSLESPFEGPPARRERSSCFVSRSPTYLRTFDFPIRLFFRTFFFFSFFFLFLFFSNSYRLKFGGGAAAIFSPEKLVIQILVPYLSLSLWMFWLFHPPREEFCMSFRFPAYFPLFLAPGFKNFLQRLRDTRCKNFGS